MRLYKELLSRQSGDRGTEMGPVKVRLEKVHYEGAMKRRLKTIGVLGLLRRFIALQFTNPSHPESARLPGHDLFATNAPPPPVAALLRELNATTANSFETKMALGKLRRSCFMVFGARRRQCRPLQPELFRLAPRQTQVAPASDGGTIADAVENGEMPLPNYALMPRPRAPGRAPSARNWSNGRRSKPDR